MKDSYTFDADEAGLDAAFERHEKAYARIFERCGLEAYLVEAESGVMGGKSSLGFLAPTGSGENELMRCENGDYFADAEAARGRTSTTGAAAGARRSRGRGHARRRHDRGARRVPRRSRSPQPRRRCRSSPATGSCSRSSGATTSSVRRSSRRSSRRRSDPRPTKRFARPSGPAEARSARSASIST